MATHKVPVADCDCESDTPGIYRALKPSKEPPSITMLAPRHPVLSAHLEFSPGNWATQPSVRINAVVQWGPKWGDTQSKEIITASAPNAFRGDGYANFCKLAIPQLLTLWREISEIPVGGHHSAPGDVIWRVTKD